MDDTYYQYYSSVLQSSTATTSANNTTGWNEVPIYPPSWGKTVTIPASLDQWGAVKGCTCGTCTQRRKKQGHGKDLFT